MEFIPKAINKRLRLNSKHQLFQNTFNAIPIQEPYKEEYPVQAQVLSLYRIAKQILNQQFLL